MWKKSDLEVFAEALGNRELAEDLVEQIGGMERLPYVGTRELQRVRGIGEATAKRVLAIISLAKRMGAEQPTQEPIYSPKQAFALLKETLEMQERELFVTLLLDIRRRAIGQEVVSVGTLSRTLVHPRELFYAAIKQKAAGMIIAHNHPSGDPTPSAEDVRITKSLISAGRMLGIPIHDHIIVGKGSFFSLRSHSATW